jgi:hypothetical protein
LKRVNIVLSKEQHNRFKDYSKRYHGSLSQFLRFAGENAIDKANDDLDFLFRPIMMKQDEGQNLMEIILQKIKTLQSNNNHQFASYQEPAIIAELETILLESNNPLSVPEIMDYTSYPQQEIIKGIEWLLDQCQISRMERMNAPSKYKIRGVSYE